jgi:hypothetical protein
MEQKSYLLDFDVKNLKAALYSIDKVIQQLMRGDFIVEGSLYINNNLYVIDGAYYIAESTITPEDPPSKCCVIWLNSSGELEIKYNDGTNIKSGSLSF